MKPIIAQPTNLWWINFPYNVDYVAHKLQMIWKLISVMINKFIIMFYGNAMPI